MLGARTFGLERYSRKPGGCGRVKELSEQIDYRKISQSLNLIEEWENITKALAPKKEKLPTNPVDETLACRYRKSDDWVSIFHSTDFPSLKIFGLDFLRIEQNFFISVRTRVSSDSQF